MSPRFQTWHPTDASPAQTVPRNSGPETRPSQPTVKSAPRKYVPVAIDNLSIISGVSCLLTMPRTPLVPKSFRSTKHHTS